MLRSQATSKIFINQLKFPPLTDTACLYPLSCYYRVSKLAFHSLSLAWVCQIKCCWLRRSWALIIISCFSFFACCLGYSPMCSSPCFPSPFPLLFSRLRAQPVLMSFNLWQIYLCINLKFALSRFRFSRLLPGSDYRLAQGTPSLLTLKT